MARARAGSGHVAWTVAPVKVEEPYRGWSGELVVLGRQVRVFVEATTAKTRDARVLSALPRIVKALDEGIPAVVRLYEEDWNAGHDVTRALRKMALQSIHIDQRHGCEISLSDGGLFRGHTVVLHVSKAGKVGVSLAG